MDAIQSYVVSQEESLREADLLREWGLATTLGAGHEKTCHTINVYSGLPVVPLTLLSKESRGFVNKLMDPLRERVYALHRFIMILYTPSVLKTAVGSLSMKMLNQDTGETIDVAVEHPVSQAATFVCRWPRAILAKSAGLALLAAVDGVDVKRGALVGVLSPFWEDKVSTKMVYEKELPTLMYPLEEQEPAYYVKDLRKLRSVVASKVLLGGKGTDMEEQTISFVGKPKQVVLPSMEGVKALPAGGSGSYYRRKSAPGAGV